MDERKVSTTTAAPSRLVFSIALALAFPALRAAADIGASEVEAARAALATERTATSTAVDPLRREIRALEAEVAAQREQAGRLLRLKIEGRGIAGSLRERLSAHQGDYQEAARRLEDLDLKLRGRLAPGEATAAAAAPAAAAAADGSPEKRFRAALAGVREAFHRTRFRTGGARAEGEAIGPAGEILEGTLIYAGPVTFFAPRTGPGGAAAAIGGTGLTRFEPIAHPAARNLGAVAGGAEALAPIDPTLGDASRVAAFREPLGQHLAEGGPVVLALLVLAAAAAATGVAKAWQLVRLHRARTRDLEVFVGLVQGGHRDEASALAAACRGPAGALLATALANAGRGHRRLEDTFEEVLLGARASLRGGLHFIATAAAAAPLLGLLGTVTGMIETFGLITVFGTRETGGLSSGISEALITTEVGLVIAIPALVLHALLARSSNGFIGELDRAAALLVRTLSPPKAGAGVGGEATP